MDMVGECTEQISIHAPREGSDNQAVNVNVNANVFLSTLPARGATSGRQAGKHRPQHFYPRSPRGERHFDIFANAGNIEFLSTLPARGATGGKRVDRAQPSISIHAPREGSDTAGSCRLSAAWNFYPRSPRGERPIKEAEI